MIVQEVERGRQRDLAALAEAFDAIRRHIAVEHEMSVEAIALIKAGSIPKTSSGKIQRHACRDGFLQGTLDIVDQWRGWSGGKKRDKPALAPAGFGENGNGAAVAAPPGQGGEPGAGTGHDHAPKVSDTARPDRVERSASGRQGTGRQPDARNEHPRPGSRFTGADGNRRGVGRGLRWTIPRGRAADDGNLPRSRRRRASLFGRHAEATRPPGHRRIAARRLTASISSRNTWRSSRT